MGIFIGLESQAPSVYAEMEDGANILTDLIGDCDADMIAEFEKSASLELIGVENLMEIKNQIESGDMSSVEAVFGPSLEAAGVDLSSENVAVESIMGKIKSGMHRVWEFIMKMVAWVKDFFTKRFGKFNGYSKSLKKRKRDLDDGKKGIKVRKSKTENEKCSQNTMTFTNIGKVLTAVTGKAVVAFDYEKLDTIATSIMEELYTVEPDSDEDVTTYEVDDKLDDMLDTDRDVFDVIGVTADDAQVSNNDLKVVNKDKPSGNKLDPYITKLDTAATLASSLGNGKLYQYIQKSLNKTSSKIDKELKKADYSDDEKDNAKTMRNQISAKNKINKIILKGCAAAMASLLAPSVTKMPTEEKNKAK